MKKNFKISISAILILITLLFLFIIFDFTKKQFDYGKIKKVIPQKYIATLEEKSTKFKDFQFNLKKKKNFLIDDKEINFENYSNSFLKHRYYLTQDDNNIFAVTKRGEFFYFLKNDLIDHKKFKLKKIKTNIQKIVGKEYIREFNTVVKGMIIIDKEIYISYIHNNNGCFSNAILKGNLNKDNIIFSPFFNIDECKNRFVNSVGGNMQYFKNNKILLTTGDYESYEMAFEDDPQNRNSYYGKILSIDLNNKKIDILSIGHRNPQGLYYDFKNDIIFMTEHGPQGGDEVNINVNPNSNEIKNYGWAISSYGEHYGSRDGLSELIKNNKDLSTELYDVAPLNKSHSEYGFIEPIKFFTPSIGITQILKVKSLINNEHKLLVGSMGWGSRPDDMTLHVLHFDKNFEETVYNKIFIGERIRDMIDLKNGSILMSLETSDSFGLLKNIY